MFSLTYNKNGDPTGEKDLTVDALKQEILDNCGEDTLLILPEAKRLTTSIRYWLEDMVIMPVIIAMLFSFAVVRFIGMGTGNKGLYITGGVYLVSAMA
ncbi:MAG: hypothetical protein ACRC80_05180, partial [Waterburya sp.]